MILVSTHRKLVEKGAKIYRVDFPASTVMNKAIPAFHEHFATRAQANKYVENFNVFGRSATITELAAASFNPWMDR